MSTAAFPATLTAESAFLALDGPHDQRIRELRTIIKLCSGHPTDEAAALSAEAQDYLDEQLGG